MTSHQPYAWVCVGCEHRVALHTLQAPDGLYQCPCGCNIVGKADEMFGIDRAACETGRYEPHQHDWIQQIGPGMTSRHVCSICRVVSSPGTPAGGDDL